MIKVYLAGPMDGLTVEEAAGWREYAADVLRIHGITAFSPLRGKARGLANRVIQDDHTFSDRFINARDHNDCLTADAILVNLLGAQKVSVGTSMEIAWAKAYRKPCIVAMEKKGNPHDHPMVRDCIDFRAFDLTTALEQTIGALRPDMTPQVTMTPVFSMVVGSIG